MLCVAVRPCVCASVLSFVDRYAIMVPIVWYPLLARERHSRAVVFAVTASPSSFVIAWSGLVTAFPTLMLLYPSGDGWCCDRDTRGIVQRCVFFLFVFGAFSPYFPG